MNEPPIIVRGELSDEDLDAIQEIARGHLHGNSYILKVIDKDHGKAEADVGVIVNPRCGWGKTLKLEKHPAGWEVASTEGWIA